MGGCTIYAYMLDWKKKKMVVAKATNKFQEIHFLMHFSRQKITWTLLYMNMMAIWNLSTYML